MTDYTLAEMKENRRLWVEALRSGKYKQGRGSLHSEDHHFCCLGVLCDVAGSNWHLDKNSQLFVADGSNWTTPPASAQRFVGLKSGLGGFLPYGQSLASENDNGATFSEIADLIESNPPGLFIDSTEEAR